MRREKQDADEQKRLELETQQLRLKKVKIYSSNMLRREQRFIDMVVILVSNAV